MGTGEAPRWRQSADPPPAPCPDPPGPGAATGAAGAEDSADTPPEEPTDRLRALAEARDRLQALLDAVLTISRELELPVVLRRIVTTAMDLVGARYGALGVLDGTGSRLDQFITAGFTEQERADLAGSDFPRGRGVLGHLIHHPQPLRLADLTAHPASVGFPPGHPHMRTLLGAAITVRGKVYGDLYLSERHDGQPFDAQDEEILVALAGAAGIAIANARLYEQVHSGAEHFQRLLLPAVPDLRPFEAAAVYRPAAQPHHLGGDWYDTMLLPDGSCAAVIGDVVGHDLNAAAAMAQARNMLRALVYDRCTPPSEVLHQLDRTLQAITDVPVTTACLARLEPDPPAPPDTPAPPDDSSTPTPPDEPTPPDDPGPGDAPTAATDPATPGDPPAGGPARTSTWTLHWSSAGHQPPLLLTPDGRTEFLWGEPGLPLGVVLDQDRPDHRHTVPAGSTVLFFTDGLVEHPAHPLDTSLEALAKLAVSCSEMPLEEFVTALADQHPSDGHDDMALLAVRIPHPG
ncbi:PP2C family protein-serine/threonine phosphatase [Streptomyces pactum]|uniref:PP2C family protein-serine/threonine phosphatase n=1 Tax=Streptomyces pactum TaxID=68249 RepID=UPI0036F83AFC